MDILAIGDLHGDMETAARLVERHRPDLLLAPGDWGDPGEVSRADWEGLLAHVHVVTVYGNHDDTDLLRSLSNTDGTPVLAENGRILDVNGLRITGINGIWAKSHRQPYYVTDEDVESIVGSLSTDLSPVDILLTHGCPLGVADLTPANRHGGQRCFMAAFQALAPRLYICGHLHRRQEYRTKDGALILNTGDGRRAHHALLTLSPRDRVFLTAEDEDGAEI
jgi:Icc-related predicted phosphoesterase